MSSLDRTAGRVLTMAEVATLIRTSEATLRYWRHRTSAGMPTGPHSYKIGRRVAYNEVDVRAWLDKQYARGADRTA